MDRYSCIEDYVVAFFSEEISCTCNFSCEESLRRKAIEKILAKRGISYDRKIDIDYILKNIKWSSR